MSAKLYDIRLFWDGRHGCARFDQIEVELRACPMPGLQEVDYAPEVKVALVREANQARRDMTPEESRFCEALLERCARAAREALA
ncbi:MAG: hypothetical protein ACREUF_04370 [Solimonas sp.]